MWPIQTLTLLLCLTDDEQLFAQRAPQEPVQQVTEVELGQQDDLMTEKDLRWDPTC